MGDAFVLPISRRRIQDETQQNRAGPGRNVIGRLPDIPSGMRRAGE
jgi:hypothetical protein